MVWGGTPILRNIIQDHSQRQCISRKRNVQSKVIKEEKEDGYVYLNRIN